MSHSGTICAMLSQRWVLASLGVLMGCSEPPAQARAVPEAMPTPASVASVEPESVPALPTTVPAPPSLGPVGEQGAAAEAETPLRPALHHVPAGTFLMGAAPGTPLAADAPQHPVHITRPFLAMRTEVTQGQWRAVMGDQPAFFTACGDACPMERVSWFDAAVFANTLSTKENRTACYRLEGCASTRGCGGNHHWCMSAGCAVAERVPGCTGYRLPTEAEWEYAVRGGTWELAQPGPDLLRAHAHFSDNSAVTYGDNHNCTDQGGRPERCGPWPVGGLLANAWGLYDMLGNVAEWCDDWYDANGPAGRAADPHGAPSGRLRVVRGGSWFSSPQWVHPALRESADPTRRTHGVGFRLVRAL